jgi:hypothetical protein
MLIFGDGLQSDYRILVSRSENRPNADLYDFNLQDVIPSFTLSLRSGDDEPVVDLQSFLSGIYDRSSYDLVINYQQNLLPPLSEVDTIWLDGILRQQGLR